MNLVLSFRWHRDYHGRTGSGGGTEWPSSPWRLMCALVAANNPASVADLSPALLWLAEQSNPTIFSPPTGEAYDMPTHSVPLNDLHSPAADPFRQSDTARLRLIKFRQDLCLPLRGSREIWFVWAAEEAAARVHLDSLDSLMSMVPYLGTSQDAGIGRAWLQGPETLEPADRCRWEPASAPGVSLPTATPTVLRGLVDFYQARQRQTRRFAEVNPPRVYYRRKDDPQALRVVLRLEDASGGLTAFPAAKCCVLAEAVRARLLEAAAVVERCPDFIHGHHAKDRDHVFIVPLPSIGHAHADSMIRRVLLFGTPPEDERLAIDLVLREFAFSTMALEGRDVVLAPEDAESGVARSYLSESTTWQTVTPVVLPNPELRGREGARWKERSDLSPSEKQQLLDLLQERRVAIVCRMFTNAGLRPKHVVVSEQPFAGGEMPARKFIVPDKRKKYLTNTRCHVMVEFSEPVSGPLVLGRGKNFGLGLFAPTRVLQRRTSSEAALAG